MQHSYDIIICGSGTVGLTIANLLNKLNYKICIFEQRPNINQDFNAVGINNECLKVLDICGIYNEIREYIAFNDNKNLMMKYLDNENNNLFSLYQSYDKNNYPIGVVFLQNKIDEILLNNLKEKVDIKFNEKVENIKQDNSLVSIQTNKGNYSAKYLIGSDGKYSIVREFINAKMNILSESKDKWLILNILRKEYPKKEYVEVFCGKRSIVSCMLPENWHRIEMTLKDCDQDIINNESRIRQILSKYIDLGEYEIKRKFEIRFQTGIVDKYYKGNVVLCGDAAHITSPFAASGLVSGMQDCLELYRLFQNKNKTIVFKIYQKLRYKNQLKKLKLAIRMEKIMRHGKIVNYMLRYFFKVSQYFPFINGFFKIR